MSPGPFKWVRRITGRGELDCDDIRSLSSDYVDETMKESITDNFRRHLGSCGNCNSFVATFRATVLTLRDLPHRSPPPDLAERVRKRVEAASSAEQE